MNWIGTKHIGNLFRAETQGKEKHQLPLMQQLAPAVGMKDLRREGGYHSIEHLGRNCRKQGIYKELLSVEPSVGLWHSSHVWILTSGGYLEYLWKSKSEYLDATSSTSGRVSLNIWRLPRVPLEE